MAVAPKVSDVVNDLIDEISKDAEKIVLDTFPKKIKELSSQLKGELFDMSNLTGIHTDLHLPVHNVVNGSGEDKDVKPGSKRRRTVDKTEETQPKIIGHKVVPVFKSEVPSNTNLEAIVDYLKPEIIDAVSCCNKIKLWVQLLIPKIEDGNNFGVSIQEDILSEVTKAESDAGSYLEQLSRYFSTRAKLICKVAKYPYLNDYRRAVNEYDEKVFFSFRLILTEIRNIYAILYDMILKNYEKLKRPRTAHTNSLY